MLCICEHKRNNDYTMNEIVREIKEDALNLLDLPIQ